MVKYCERCGKKLETAEEKDIGLCDECQEDEEEGLNLASSIIHTPGFGPVDLDEF